MAPLDAAPHDWKEWRRRRALDLARQGWRQRDIAAALDASKSAVSQWLRSARQDGPEALASHPVPGRPAKLTTEQIQRIPDFLWHGAEAYGFRGNVWTCDRVVGVLVEEFGVAYSRSQVSRLLKRLGWTPQVPITRALQRDEAAIRRWRQQAWPALKSRAQRERRSVVFVDESGFYLLPSVLKTYAPRGHPATLLECRTRDHLSVMGAVTVEGRVYSLVRQDALNGEHAIAFLAHLLRVTGERLWVVWDGSPIHRRGKVIEFITAQTGSRIRLEALPPYAPDLNPVEGLWQRLKAAELGNMTCLDLEQLHMELHLALGRVRQRPDLIRSLFLAAGLSL